MISSNNCEIYWERFLLSFLQLSRASWGARSSAWHQGGRGHRLLWRTRSLWWVKSNFILLLNVLHSLRSASIVNSRCIDTPLYSAYNTSCNIMYLSHYNEIDLTQYWPFPGQSIFHIIHKVILRSRAVFRAVDNVRYFIDLQIYSSRFFNLPSPIYFSIRR